MAMTATKASLSEIAMENGPNGFSESVEAEILQVMERKQADFQQMQYNLLREQISNVSRELTSLRQDINTLRLADSQSEVQSAEAARHVREMQAHMQSEMQSEVSRSEELVLNLDVRVSTALAEAKQATQGLAEMQERVAHNLLQTDERITQLLGSCEERFAGIRALQVLVEEEKSSLHKTSAVSYELTSEVRSMKADFDTQLSGMHSSLRQAVGCLKDELGGEMHSLKERCGAVNVSIQYLEERTKNNLTAVQESLKDQLEQQSRESSTRHADVQELISRSSAQERVAREELASNQLIELQDVQSRCRSETSEKLLDFKSGTERTHASLQELVVQERAVREKALGSLGERLGDFDRRIKDSAAELCNFQNKAASCTMLESLERKLSNETARQSDEFGVKYDQLKASVVNVLDSIEGLERKVERRAKGEETAATSGSSPVEGMLASLERKLRDEFAGQTAEYRGRLQELKDQLVRVSNEISTKHSEVSELIARVSVQEKATREEDRLQSGHALDALEQKLHREIASADVRHESAAQERAQEVRNRERAQVAIYERLEEVDRRARDATASEFRKLREDLVAEHAGRQTELKESLMKISLEMTSRQTEHKDQVEKKQSGERSAREELRVAILQSTDTMAAKLRRELEESKAIAERTGNALRTQLTRERQDREAQCNSIGSSVSIMERRCREEISARIDEQRSAFYELKDDVAKALASEISVRDELRMSVASSVEGLESKMRREFSDDSIIRESVTQERQLREKGLNGLSERISDVERKAVAELAQVAIKREVALTELKDALTDTWSRERGRSQELLLKETEARTQLQDAVQKGLSQERAAREVQQETLRVYLAQDRGQRDVPIQALRERIEPLRAELDLSLRRVWEVVDAHSHVLSSRQAIQQVPTATLAVPAQTNAVRSTVFLPPSGAVASQAAERVVNIPTDTVIASTPQMLTRGIRALSPPRALSRPPAVVGTRPIMEAAGYAARAGGSSSSWAPMTSQSRPLSLSVEPGLIISSSYNADPGPTVVRTTRQINQDSSGVITTLPLMTNMQTNQAIGFPERTPSPGLMSSEPVAMEKVECVTRLEETALAYAMPSTASRTIVTPFISGTDFCGGPSVGAEAGIFPNDALSGTLAANAALSGSMTVTVDQTYSQVGTTDMTGMSFAPLPTDLPGLQVSADRILATASGLSH